MSDRTTEQRVADAHATIAQGNCDDPTLHASDVLVLAEQVKQWTAMAEVHQSLVAGMLEAMPNGTDDPIADVRRLVAAEALAERLATALRPFWLQSRHWLDKPAISNREEPADYESRAITVSIGEIKQARTALTEYDAARKPDYVAVAEHYGSDLRTVRLIVEAETEPSTQTERNPDHA